MLICKFHNDIYKQATFVTIYQYHTSVKTCDMESAPVVILENISLDLTEDEIAELARGMEQVDGLITIEDSPASTATTVTAASPASATTVTAAASPATVTPAAAPAAAVTPAASVTPAAAPAAVFDDDDWFRAGPSRTPARSSRATPRPSFGKNMAVLKSLRSPSPAPSTSTSTQSSVAEDDDSDEYTKFLEDEQRRRNEEETRRAEEEARRAEWRRLCAVRRADVERKWARARENISSLTGEGKRLKNQREAVRAQVRALEQQLRALDDEEADLEKRKRSALKSERKYGAIVVKYREMDL